MRKTHPIFRILAIVLILASLGMVALPWISLSNYGNSEYETYYQIGKDFLDLISSHRTIDDGVLALGWRSVFRGQPAEPALFHISSVLHK